MTYDEFNQFCGGLKATTYVMQWNNSHVWKVGGKVFAIGGLGKNGERAFIFKTSDLNYHFLSEKPGYRPAPYFASRGMKWIQQFGGDETQIKINIEQNVEDLNEELSYYLHESYKLVSLGLTKKKQKELGLNQGGAQK
ncbi:Predicted DNA-binding protein (MmcQ/YjbR family) [Alteromonas sp. 38]|uniref:MmcQ/YjbR family DNA-binding protein n=1 Tax=unclassified Alteromonas TaxID=2614992 RepID=UPI0012EF90B5|nr:MULTISPECIES: MmcQ/YjbR family DNA-binding protein [unclassified Alteromonas]CAD5248826.1 Predicted DNA-binding protein (MmcQ/YjbR family) [Alteromonas sp. 154]VXC49255.1 Predicted DNA-binding protein (MmcQ/YjbR family) [Alteromonas sp. 38]